MEYLDIIFDVIGNSFGISNLYLQSLIVLVLFIVVARILLFVFSQYLQVMAKKTKTNFDDILFDKTKMPIFYLINSYGFKLALANVYQGIVANNVVNSIIVVFFVLLLSRLLDVIIITWGESFAKKTKTKVYGPIPLPTRKMKLTTRKSPDGEGKASWERYEMRVHKRLIELGLDERALRLIMRVPIPEGINIEIEILE